MHRGDIGSSDVSVWNILHHEKEKNFVELRGQPAFHIGTRFRALIRHLHLKANCQDFSERIPENSGK